MKRFLKRVLCAVMLVFMSVVARPQAREGLRYAEPFSVEGLEVGTPVAPNSHAYKRYKCHPSEQYLNSVTCLFSEVKNGVSKHLTILHLYNNIVIYVNKSISPAVFSGPDIRNEIERLSGNYPALFLGWRFWGVSARVSRIVWKGFAPFSLAVSTVVRTSASACAAHMAR